MSNLLVQYEFQSNFFSQRILSELVLCTQCRLIANSNVGRQHTVICSDICTVQTFTIHISLHRYLHNVISHPGKSKTPLPHLSFSIGNIIESKQQACSFCHVLVFMEKSREGQNSLEKNKLGYKPPSSDARSKCI